MNYQEMPPIERSVAERIFSGNSSEKIRETLVRVTFHEPDWRWVQSKCLGFLKSPDVEIQSVAIICLGHLARIHKTLDLGLVRPILVSMLNDKILSGPVSDALDDIDIFIDNNDQ